MKEKKNKLCRREAVSTLLNMRDDSLVVTGLGGTCWDVTAVGDTPLNFPMWGGMGGAAMVGLGLSLAQPDRKVIVITGDGEMLMGLSSLATIGASSPKNLTITIIDNEHFGETGMQPAHTGLGTDIAKVAQGTGFKKSQTIYSSEELICFGKKIKNFEGPNLAVIKVSTDYVPLVLPPRDGAYLKDRFRLSLLGKKATI